MRELEPWADSYTHVYEATGLLTDRTVLAHCIHLSDDEVRAIRESGAGIAHCPNSNCSIRDSIQCPYKYHESQNVLYCCHLLMLCRGNPTLGCHSRQCY